MHSCTMLLIVVLLFAQQANSLFEPKQSSSFNSGLFASHPQFQNSYADDSTIAGYVGKDVIKWGDYSATVSFGCASEDDTTGVWDNDGILGLGLKDKETDNSLSTPFFYSLCDSNSMDCIFSLLLTEVGGEIQLGGYNNDAIAAGSSITWAPITTPCCTNEVSYQITITQIRIGSGRTSQLLYAAPTSNPDMVTIVDSGISCLLLPASVTSGTQRNVDVFRNARNFVAANTAPILYFTINGVEFSVPIGTNCIQSSGSNELGLGDPFFRELLVIHDLTNRDLPRMGFVPVNPTYNPVKSLRNVHTINSMDELRKSFAKLDDNNVKSNLSEVTTLPLFKLQVERNNNKRNNNKRNVLRSEQVPVTTPNQNIYFTSLSVGTPAQSPFVVQVDTGSSLTAVFTQKGSPTAAWQVALFTISMIVIFVGLVAGAVIYYRKRSQRQARESVGAGEYKLLDT